MRRPRFCLARPQDGQSGFGMSHSLKPGMHSRTFSRVALQKPLGGPWDKGLPSPQMWRRVVEIFRPLLLLPKPREVVGEGREEKEVPIPSSLLMRNLAGGLGKPCHFNSECVDLVRQVPFGKPEWQWGFVLPNISREVRLHFWTMRPWPTFAFLFCTRFSISTFSIKGMYYFIIRKASGNVTLKKMKSAFGKFPHPRKPVTCTGSEMTHHVPGTVEQSKKHPNICTGTCVEPGINSIPRGRGRKWEVGILLFLL